MEWFYMRVSTQSRKETEKDKEQNFERQIGIFERAGFDLNDNNTFADRISGSVSANEREQFDKMLDKLNAGDTVHFTETSRFARSYISGMEMLDTLIFDKNVNVKFISNGIDLLANGNFNPYTWYTISQMLLADELQRRIISYNTINGLQRKKEQGVVLGRPKTQIDENIKKDIVSKYKKGENITQITESSPVGRRIVERIVKQYIFSIQKSKGGAKI